jgi:hypothetical protein
MSGSPTNPLAVLGDWLQNLLIVAFNLATQHPYVSGGVAGWFAAAYCVTCVVKGVYPSSKWAPDERPPLARVLLNICTPFTTFLSRLVEFLLRKVGIGPAAPGDTP